MMEITRADLQPTGETPAEAREAEHMCDLCDLYGMETPAAYATRDKHKGLADWLFELPRHVRVCEECYREFPPGEVSMKRQKPKTEHAEKGLEKLDKAADLLEEATRHFCEEARAGRTDLATAEASFGPFAKRIREKRRKLLARFDMLD